MANGKPYVDQVLTQISQKYTNDDTSFIAEKIFPIVNVPKPTGIYFEYNRENLKKPVSTVRTGRGATPEASYSRKQQTFGPLLEHDLKDFITWQEMKTYDNPLNPETDAVLFLNEQMAIEKEVALATKLSDTAIITQNVNLATNPITQWSDYSNSNPFTDIQTAITNQTKNGLKAPNCVFMGYEVWAQIVNHPDFLDRIKFNSLGVVTPESFKSLFSTMGIDNLWIGKSVYDSAAEGLTATNGFAWGKNFWTAYVGGPSLRSVNGGLTLTLQDGRYVDRWEDTDQKASYIRNNDFYEQKLVGVEAFYLVKNAVA